MARATLSCPGSCEFLRLMPAYRYRPDHGLRRQSRLTPASSKRQQMWRGSCRARSYLSRFAVEMRAGAPSSRITVRSTPLCVQERSLRSWFRPDHRCGAAEGCTACSVDRKYVLPQWIPLLRSKSWFGLPMANPVVNRSTYQEGAHRVEILRSAGLYVVYRCM